MDGYGKLAAEFYDLTKPIDGDYHDVDYYLQHLRKTKGSILEAGVGTGRLLVPLAKAGLRMVGLDDSEAMLEICRRHCASHKLKTTLHRATLQAFQSKEKFAAIVMPLGSFMILEKRAEAVAVLKNFARLLEPGGKLFIDLDVARPELHRAGLKVYGTTVEAADGSQIILEGSRTYDMVEQVETVFLRYERWKQGQLFETEIQRLALRWYGRYEFSSLLREVGFKNISVCSDYEEGLEPHSQSDMLCFRGSL